MKIKFQAKLDDAQKNVLEGIEHLGNIHNDLTTLNGVLFDEDVNGFYIPKHYGLCELLPKEVHDTLSDSGDINIGWALFDNRLLWTIDVLREKWDTPVYINTWHKELRYVFQDVFNYSGLRPFNCKVGASWSQHKFGRAADLKPISMNIEHIISDMKNNPDIPEYKYITCVEEKINGRTPSWLHVDVRNGKHIKFISC